MVKYFINIFKYNILQFEIIYIKYYIISYFFKIDIKFLHVK